MAKGRWRSLRQWVKIALYIRFTWHSFVPFSNLSRPSLARLRGSLVAFTTHSTGDIYISGLDIWTRGIQAFEYSALIRSAIFSATANVGAAVWPAGILCDDTAQISTDKRGPPWKNSTYVGNTLASTTLNPRTP